MRASPCFAVGGTLFLHLGDILLVLEKTGLALSWRRFATTDWALVLTLGRLSRLARLVVAAWRYI